MYQYKKNNIYLNQFENITELANYVSKRKTVSGRNSDSMQEGDSAERFTTTKSLEEAIELFRYGDEALLEKIKEEQKKFDIDKFLGNAIKRNNYTNEVYGSVPNVPLYLIGASPVNMITKKPLSISHKVVNIFLNIRVNGGTSAKTIIKIGSMYLTLIDLLEKHNYRCNLYSGTVNDVHGETHILMVKVKTDREPLNLKKICFTIANPSMQRRIKFRWMEVNDADEFAYGYGGYRTKEESTEALKKVFKEDYYIWTYEDAEGSNIDNLVAELEKQGLKLS